MYDLIENDALAISRWDELVYSMPCGTIFHTLEWLNMIDKNQSLHTMHIGIYLDEELLGVFPLSIKRILFFKVAASPFIVEDTPYMGPVIDPCHIRNMLPALDALLKRNGIQYVRIISSDMYTKIDANSSYKFIDKQTHVLDITETDDELWKNMEGRCRTAIRKAQKSGVVIKRACDRDYIEEHYKIIEQVYHAQNRPCPNSRELYYDIWDIFNPSNAIFLYAEYNNAIIAGSIIVVDRYRAYYLNGVSKHEFRSLSASNLLLWEAIKIVKQMGVQEFDFVGSDIPRLSRFKKGFGGQLTAYTLIEKANSKWISWLREKYPAYRKTVGNIIERINPS